MLVGEYRMESQKKIALINDVTGFGRCSVAVELPLVSALKVQGCVLPTAILSVHTGFPEFYIDDYTNRMTEYIDSWLQNQLTLATPADNEDGDGIWVQTRHGHVRVLLQEIEWIEAAGDYVLLHTAARSYL